MNIHETQYVLEDGIGYVEYLDHMGSDSTMVRAAKQSYGSWDDDLPYEDVKRLLYYLTEHHHTSPLEWGRIAFKIKAPLFIIQQILRHRTASLCQFSHRYKGAKPEYYVPPIHRMRANCSTNKQGSGEQLDDADMLRKIIDHASKEAFAEYRYLLDNGVSNEVARSVLPHNTYSTLVWQNDFHNLSHFFYLRSDSHAQWEIRQYSDAMFQIAQELFPLATKAFVEFRRDSVSFSAGEVHALRRGLDQDPEEQFHYSGLCSSRRRRAFYDKLTGGDE